MKLLVVEDDKGLAEAIAQHLNTQHYLVEIAPDGDAGIDLVQAFEYDLVLLDLHLPTINGIQFCHQLRKIGKDLPVLLMTAEDSQTQKIAGLDAGADDYIVKPLYMEELSARVRALLRRGRSAPSSLLTWGNVSLNPANCNVFCQHQKISLTAKEYELLELFLRYPQRIFSINLLVERLWTIDKLPSDGAVRSHIKSLRRKLKKHGVEKMIETIYGLGYRLCSNQQPSQPHPSNASSSAQANLPELYADESSELSMERLIESPRDQTPSDPGKTSVDTQRILQQAWQKTKDYYWPMVADLEHTAELLQQETYPPVSSDEGTHQKTEENTLTPTLSTLLSQEQLERSRRHAHTLKGALGCFGCMDGSQLASQIEKLLLNPSCSPNRLSTLVAQLRPFLLRLTQFDDLDSSQQTNQTPVPDHSLDQTPATVTRQPISTQPKTGEHPHPQWAKPSGPKRQWLIVETNKSLIQELIQHTAPWDIQLHVVDTPIAAQQWLTDLLAHEASHAEAFHLEASHIEASHADASHIETSQYETPLYEPPLPNAYALPEVVIVDPNCTHAMDDGLSFISELTHHFPLLPVIVATNEDTLSHRVKSLRSGSYAFLQKPVNAAQVLETVNHCMNRTALPSSRILALDDDPGILACLHEHLTPWGFQLTVLTNALQFWSVLEQATPDLILLDIEMPDLNGLELCQVIRNDPKLYQIPILILSAHREPEMVRQVFEAGADDYLNKPIIGSELVARILNRLDRVQLLRNLAETDHLTGLTQRHSSVKSLHKLLRLAQRQQTTLCFALIDLDQFKLVNDKYGHDMGDRVLKTIGDYLRQTFRGEDVVSRWGGEEFVVGLYDVSKAIALQRLTTVLEAFHQHVFQDEQQRTFNVSFSGGIAAYPEDGHDIHSLHTQADVLLYRAKAAGRNQIIM